MKLGCIAVLVLIGSLAGLSGCVQQNIAPVSSVAPDLAEALAFAPANVASFAFTDWSLIKEYEGVENVTSKSNDTDRRRFLSSLATRQAPASSFGLSDLLTEPAKTWSFDGTDYLWESTLTGISNSSIETYVVKLRNDFNLTQLIADFNSRGFEASSYRSATIYTYSSSDYSAISTDWFGPYGYSILNTAIVATQKMLIFGNTADIHAVLDAYNNATPNLASDSTLHNFVLGLGTLFSVEIMPGGDVCSALSSLPQKMQTILQSDKSGVAELHPYEWLGLGYRYDLKHLSGLIGLHFAHEADARADLEPRRQLAAHGTSLFSDQPYSKDIFTVDDAVVQSDNLLLQVSPINAEPARLFDGVMYFDFAYAACPA